MNVTKLEITYKELNEDEGIQSTRLMHGGRNQEDIIYSFGFFETRLHGHTVILSWRNVKYTYCVISIFHIEPQQIMNE